jgi:tetratricopeptide (TPR) repeat protein
VLEPLDRAEAELLVGAEAAARLHDRSGGNPLFLLELAKTTDEQLPASVQEAVMSRVPSDPTARAVIEAAAALGCTHPELLSRVVGITPIAAIEHLMSAVERGLLDERADTLHFHHDLVREAIATRLGSARRALLHREAARVLATDETADPGVVAEHARLGGDTRLAADAYARAAEIATARFDHETAVSLLDRSISFDPAPSRLLARARAATLAGHFADARRDVDAALTAGIGGEVYEIGAWAAYFARDFATATQFADEGAALAADRETTARCLVIGGRIRHATGDLARAEELLESAVTRTTGADRAVATAWLGVLRSHQSRPDDALALLRPVARASGPTDTAAHLHAMLFTGHALALGGRPDEALRVFDRYEAEAERRNALRFRYRGDNCAAWVLRHLGDEPAALERNERAREAVGTDARFAETAVAAELDLTEGALLAGDADRAIAHLDRADRAWTDSMVFGWRLDLKRRLHRARVALLEERWDDARGAAGAVAQRAQELGIPRYAASARLVGHEARLRAGEAPAREQVAVDLATLRHEPEGWWATARAATVFGVTAWRQMAAAQVASLCPLAGDRIDTLRRVADRRFGDS